MRKASIIWDAAILRSPQDYIPRRLLNRQTMNRGLVGNRVGDGVLEVTVESGTLAYSQKDMKPERSSKRGRLSRDYFKNTRRSIRSRKELHRTQSHFSRWEAQWSHGLGKRWKSKNVRSWGSKGTWSPKACWPEEQRAVSGSDRSLDWDNHEQEATAIAFGGQCEWYLETGIAKQCKECKSLHCSYPLRSSISTS